jgi:acid phosphatase (class A)
VSLRRTFPILVLSALAGVAGIVSISCADGGRAFIDPAVVVLERVIPPPAAAGSAAERAELDEMLRIQMQRTPVQAERAKADADTSIFRFADAIGSPPGFAEGKLPKLTALFKRIRDAETAVIGPAKDHYARPRPSVTEPKLDPVISVPGSMAYPSGHAAWAFAAGLVLADMIPEKRAQILARAAEFAHNRVVAGVHYPSDVDAGRVSGSVLAAFLFASPAFSAEESLASAELRTALQLPPLH